jgi:hypothetical protein
LEIKYQFYRGTNLVRRVETIELLGHKQDEIMEEFNNDVKKRTKEGWVLLSYSSKVSLGEFCLKYKMERRFPYN